MMYNLEMWDTGERYLHKFDYILPACVKNCDVILFFFSITDRYDIFNVSIRVEELVRQIGQAITISQLMTQKFFILVIYWSDLCKHYSRDLTPCQSAYEIYKSNDLFII